ncbi:hypothetical protein [Psychrobacter lutiphocae]|uniref:hypothetical protein n=1 Tax=Psychrobacter lutiphocae TaxID=540500 RepID=UPI00036B282A|nr:hypothetical protein [Psychrobacter lutiphocae]
MNNTQQRPYQVSPLTTNALMSTKQGVLATTIIPATEQLDWIVPTALILAVMPFDPHAVIELTIADEKQSAISDNSQTYLHHQGYRWQQQVISIYPLLTRLEEAEQVVILEGESDNARLAILVKGELIQREIKLLDIKDIELEATVQYGTAGEYVSQLVLVQQQAYVVPDLSALSQLAK